MLPRGLRLYLDERCLLDLVSAVGTLFAVGRVATGAASADGRGSGFIDVARGSGSGQLRPPVLNSLGAEANSCD